MLKKINLSRIKTLTMARLAVTFMTNNQYLNSQKQSLKTNFLTKNNAYVFSSQSSSNPPMSQTKITFQIQKATSPQQLHSIIKTYAGALNMIHRTVLLQKVTQRPFDNDQQLATQVILSIKSAWKHDFSQVTNKNARAIANNICYMSRKKKFHHLDSQFTHIDYYQLARFLNPKEFVMTLNGLLKLQLIDQVANTNHNQFELETFLTQNINDKFIPSLLVSMWFNLLKYKKSTPKINNFFANLLKTKHFKNNLIDYMQIVYCYVNSQATRTVDLTYPVMTHPVQINPKNFMGAHQLSVLYEQLAKLKKIKNVYFSQQFSDVLENCYLRILTERDVPLRNLANVFTYLVQYENPTSKILQATFHKFYAVIKNQITVFEKTPFNRKPRTNVDSLSFVTLFNQLFEFYQPQNKYFNQMASISMNYIDKIINNPLILNDYNERTFMRLLSGIDLTKKMAEQQNPGRNFTLNTSIKFGLQKEIIKRNFTEVLHVGKLINFIYNHDIRSKQVCVKIKKLIQSIPQENQLFSSFQQRLKQKCILNKNCKNCSNCFSN